MTQNNCQYVNQFIINIAGGVFFKVNFLLQIIILFVRSYNGHENQRSHFRD